MPMQEQYIGLYGTAKYTPKPAGAREMKGMTSHGVGPRYGPKTAFLRRS